MTGVRILVCHAIGLVLGMLLLSGCESTHQPGYGQEKGELLKTIEAQQAEIDELKRNVEATTSLLFEVTSSLEECRGKLPEAEKEKGSAKVAKKPKRSQLSTAKRRTRTSSRTKTTKRKSGCPCRRKLSKSQQSKKANG
jgi:chromosome segregation ATPase